MPARTSSAPIDRPARRSVAADDAGQADAVSAAFPAGADSGVAWQAIYALAEAIGLKRLAAMLRLAPWRPPHRPLDPRTFLAAGPERKGRVALLAGCVNDLLAPQINASAIRVLTRMGIEVVVAKGAGCCGSLVHHMGREDEALAQARANIDAWSALGDLDAIVITTSGCGTTVKDYGFMLRTDSAYAGRGRQGGRSCQGHQRISGHAAAHSRPQRAAGLVVAYHSACSLQHGQRITRQPKDLLLKLGFAVKDVPDGHCVVARQEHTIFCSRISQGGCASAKSGLSRDCDLMLLQQGISAASLRSPRARSFRPSIRSS